MVLQMRFTVTSILISSLLAFLPVSAKADPTPEISTRFQSEVPVKIYSNYKNPLPERDLSKTPLLRFTP